MSTSVSDGGLTPAGRFNRMEAALVRIEEKLDRKADLRDLVHLDARVVSLEAGETPVGKLLLDQFKEVQSQIRELHEHGSRNAQEAFTKAHELDKEVESLKKQQEIDRAVAKIQRDRSAWRWRLFGGLIAAGELGLGITVWALH